MGRAVKDFFKPYIVPRNLVPVQQVEEDEIIVGSPTQSRKAQPSRSARKACDHASTGKHEEKVRTKLLPQKSQVSRDSSVGSLGATPLKASPRKSPRSKRSAVSSLDGSNDDETLYHSSPTPSVQRAVMSVEVPSPRREQTPTPTLIYQAPLATSMLPQPPPALNTSFTSLLSSQSSSRRVMKGGMQAVTNSDSGSAEDSDEHLDDIDVLIPRKKVRLTPPLPQVLTTQRLEIAGRKSARLSDQSSKSSRSGSHTPQLPFSPPRTEYKHSLLKLVKANEKKVREDVRIAEAENKAQEAQERRDRARQATTLTMDEEMLVEKYADDSEEGEGVKRAMVRTEALLDEETFSFFASGGGVKVEDCEFPVKWLEGTALMSTLGDVGKRQRAYIMGFVADLASMSRLPEAAVKWTASQLVHERREDLREAYVEVLSLARTMGIEYEQTSLRDYYSTALSGTGLGTPAAQSDTSGLGEANQHHTTQAPGLRHVIRALSYLLPKPNLPALTTTILDLALLNIDTNLARETDLHLEIEQTLASLLTNTPPSDLLPLCAAVATGLKTMETLTPTLLCQVITSLPAISEGTHYLRWQLALRYSADIWREEMLRIEDCYSPILERLRTAEVYRINGNTDYGLLRREVEVLDLAVDGGFCKDFSGLGSGSGSGSESVMPGPTTATTENSDNHDPDNDCPEPGIAPLFNNRHLSFPPPQSPEEKNFNSRIDALSSQLKSLASRIKDGGATSLKRVECKSVFERVVVRLESGVRTRPKPKRDVFGGRSGAGVRWKVVGKGEKRRGGEKGGGEVK
ncbi:hypothetical protein LTR78_008612 [Recurvomyces mirabilis]|uniref:Uncharacterized protein n=1 Tax=Recurvomyces mirabilis TaxID=574656 RepID=A0AAE0TPV5_9PEZI|nr:hypothetical protein LTR78_008612 [Recurvomyces mirabilis]KAK5153476.1 hypothetical protein LTS14_007647 [Recurvomyces mirabilis]